MTFSMDAFSNEHRARHGIRVQPMRQSLYTLDADMDGPSRNRSREDPPSPPPQPPPSPSNWAYPESLPSLDDVLIDMVSPAFLCSEEALNFFQLDDPLAPVAC